MLETFFRASETFQIYQDEGHNLRKKNCTDPQINL